MNTSKRVKAANRVRLYMSNGFSVAVAHGAVGVLEKIASVAGLSETMTVGDSE